jgi:alkyl sulfatase BDS1-like metallo-beta-lactamase superfamily hydrolase
MLPMRIPALFAICAGLASAQSIDPELAAHTALFARKIYKVAPNVYSAVGYSLGNSIMIEGADGVIIVDTLSSVEAARLVMAEFRKITPKPIVAVVYTHFHPDHTSGVKGFVSAEDVASGRVAIYAQESLMKNYVTQGELIGPILGVRSSYSFGAGMTAEERQGMNYGLGPLYATGSTSFIQPTKTFSEQMETTIAGVKLRFTHSPSETPDHATIFLPDSRTLISGDMIQGPAFPNIHTLRGASFRDPLAWVESIDRARELKAEFLAPSHGQPVSNGAKVEEVMRNYRDGIQFVHDQTIRYMNKGMTPDELVAAVKLPPDLDHYAPYLRPFYGTVSHSVREIYVGYLGWFEGDPVALDPTPPIESARRHVTLMGGRDRVLSEARQAMEAGDAQWAAELATYLIRIRHDDHEARTVKAAAFRKLGFASKNINWRDWYLASAHELDGTLDTAAVTARARANFGSPETIAALPARTWVAGLTTRLKAEDTLAVDTTMAFRFPDVKEAYALEVRRGVAQFDERTPDRADVAIEMEKKTLDRMLLSQLTLVRGLNSGDIKVTAGTRAEVLKFFEYFEPAAGDPIALTVR